MIKGKISKMIFEADSGSKIAMFSVEESDNQFPQGVSKSSICIKGYFPSSDKIVLTIDGEWEKWKGRYQFKVTEFSEEIPDTKEGIIAYLSSGLIKGIGVKTAEKIFNRFGLKTLEVFSNTPERLLEVRGISRSKPDKIISSYQETKSVQEIIKFLAPFGVSTNKCVIIANEYGNSAIDVLKKEPFRLCEIDGFGFKTVDAIAQTVGTQLNDELRVSGAIRYILQEAEISGHICMPQTEVLHKAYTLLNDGFTHEVCSQQVVKEVFCRMAKNNALLGDGGYAYLPKNYLDEINIANSLKYRLHNTTADNSQKEKIKDALLSIQKKDKICLAQLQQQAIFEACTNDVSIITGGPGTGKTTVLKYLLKVLKNLEVINDSDDVCLLAPTGRAASRMTSSVNGEYVASTIHSRLMIMGDNLDFDNNALDGVKVVIVDEASMIDNKLFALLIQAIPFGCKIVIVGDTEQLPSVGAGNVLFELIKSKVIPVTRLEVIYRQSGTSPIAENADLIKKGIYNLCYKDKFEFITSETTAECATIIRDIFMKKVSEQGISEVQVLCPMRKNGDASVEAINALIQEAYNPHTANKAEVTKSKVTYRIGDKVMNLKNNYEQKWLRGKEIGEGIFNGEIGYIESITDEDTVIINFEGKVCEIDVCDLNNIALAYATTIHKSQGSEFKTVIMPFHKSFYVMLKRNLLYTGITRAKEECIIVGQKQAVVMAIKANDIAKRNTQLAKRLQDTTIINKEKQLSLFQKD